MVIWNKSIFFKEWTKLTYLNIYKLCRRKEGTFHIVASWLFKHAVCLTSLFCFSSFWALFWNHCSQRNSAQCSSYKSILSDKKFWIHSPHNKFYSDSFHSFSKCFWFLIQLQQTFILCTDSQVLLGVLLWANTSCCSGHLISQKCREHANNEL